MLKTGENFQIENKKEIESNKEIVLKIDNFEGPLELLLYLIEKKKMKISEIRITQIIDEYLSILEDSKRDNLEIKVEFVLIATELLEIKAYSVLSFEKEKESEKELKRRLEEYKIFKEVTKDVARLENEFNISYSKKEGRRITKVDSKEYNLDTLTLDDIYESYKKYLLKQNTEIMQIKYERTYILEDEVEKLKIFVYDKIKTLGEIFQRAENKMHLVYIFLAILDTYKEGSIDILKINEEIYIKRIN
ncbi:segregation and condensation protein A [Fusobacterium perfoetens]|uniref:segregation and condensation protein A n=1 Tax=Fusobacterium perfoetens TaxID=852 RepID=UPI000686B45A|nr:ScpA family protein [Fusobacterium perfoetens]MCI6153429.1 segregation/condensation protein A [Fusobacterium perfoetens]MDY3238428.1 ScpA family protein [Fusobacterium perfoetens]